MGIHDTHSGAQPDEPKNFGIRNFHALKLDFPAIFMFDGLYFMEQFNIDTETTKFVEVKEPTAKRWMEKTDAGS